MSDHESPPGAGRAATPDRPTTITDDTPDKPEHQLHPNGPAQQDPGDAAADLQEFFDACYGNGDGWLTISTGRNLHLNANSKPVHGQWRETHRRWPAQADQIIAGITATAPHADVYATPYLRREQARTKGAAGALALVHADIDHTLRAEAVQDLGGFAIASGTPGHAHVYIPLAWPVTPAQHELLCRGLAARLGGDHKYADNDVLRPPGTLNHKPAVAGDPPTPVEWLIRPTGARVDPTVLAEHLGVDIAHAERAAPNGSSTDGEPHLAEPIDLAPYPGVRAALAKVTGDRSRDVHRVVGACYDSRLTLPQTRWAVCTRGDLAEKVNRRRDDYIGRSWHKIRAERDRDDGHERDDGDHADVQHEADSDTGDGAAVRHSGHLGRAIKLAQQFGHNLLYVNRYGWHRWDGKRWEEDADGTARRAVHSTLKRDRRIVKSLELAPEEEEKRLKDIARYETAPAISGILTEAAALQTFSVQVRHIDADPWVLNCANGTLDLRTMQTRPHNAADRITKVCRGAYRENTPTPAWDTFVARVLPDKDVRSFVQRVAGLALLGEVREHILVIFTGVGANGKGTLYKALLYALGDYAATAEPDLFTHRDGAHPTGQMDLLGRRLVIVSESDENRQLSEATMKRLTGGDLIKARYMRENFVEFTPSHTAILVTNHLPKVSGDDPAVWRRLRVVPFNVVIPDEEQDRTLDARLQREADGILSWAITGWKDYLEHGLAEPGSIRVATDNYQRRNDAVGQFIEERCHLGPGYKATTKELYEAWQRWQESDGRASPMGRGVFGEALDRRGYHSQPPTHGKRWRLSIGVKAWEEFADED